MIAIEVQGVDELIAWLDALPDAVERAAFDKAEMLSSMLVSEVKGKLSGEVLQSRSGALKESITGSVVESGDAIDATVSAGNLPYAAIQEYGGTIKAHIIQAQNAKALAFASGGMQSFFTQVNHPAESIPGHSYLGSSLTDMQGDIDDSFSDALAEAIDNH